VLSQTDVSVRVLIIDDASPDDTAEVAAALVREDPRVTFIRHSKNRGHIATYNEGIEWASAEYFLLLSADDLLAPGALGRATKLMDENIDIVLTHGEFIEWHDHLPFPQIHEPQTLVWRRQNLIRETCATGACLVCTPTAIVRTSTQKAAGGYRPSLPHAGDMEMWLRFAARGSVARIDHPVQAISRRHSSNMSNPYFEDKISDFEQRKEVFDTFFAEHGDRVSGAESLRQNARKILSEKAYMSGIARVFRGRINSGCQLLRYSINLNPKLLYSPPVGLWIKFKLETATAMLRSRNNKNGSSYP
jgi:glycosyltransferase involved in cell wall biosynthesis